jgi:hypothetical protein
LDEGARIDVIIINFSKAFDSVPRDWLITKIVALGVYIYIYMYNIQKNHGW